jgi:hypothetical protein
VDNLAEALADTGEVGTRWALTPSVIQHVGTNSTKGKDENGVEPPPLWNFGFELNDKLRLEAEHKGTIDNDH